MTDLIDRIHAELDRRETVARAATPGPWWTPPDGDIAEWTIFGAVSADRQHGWAIASATQHPRERMHTKAKGLRMPATVVEHANANAEHIALHDPAGELLMCQELRGIVQDWQDSVHNPYEGKTDDELHDSRMHPAYEYATTEGQRKAWDYADEPPWDDELGRPGDGWERNRTSFNPEGWERFEYTEESYWRRLRPEGPLAWTPPDPPSHILRLARGLGLDTEEDE